jgi:cation diffusion facilitator family transporter
MSKNGSVSGSRFEEKRRVALVSGIVALALTMGKLVVGIYTGSLGILSEAAHSFLDLCAAWLTYFAVRATDRPADAQHHYGHGKVESMSALVEAILLGFTCLWIIAEAIRRLTGGGVHVEVTTAAFVVMGVAVVTDVWRARALSIVAKKHHSQALEADALHFSSDAGGSLVVIAGLVIVRLTDAHIADSIAAVGVATLVIVSSLRLARRTFDTLIDSAPEGMEERVKKVIESVAGVVGIHQLRARRSGNQIFMDMHIKLDGRIPLSDAHKIASIVEQRVEGDVSSLGYKTDVTVHAEPAFEHSKHRPALREPISSMVSAFRGKIAGFHDLTVKEERKKAFVNLHLVMPKNVHVDKAHDLCEQIEKKIKGEIMNVIVNIHVEPCDGNCSICQVVECEERTGKAG